MSRPHPTPMRTVTITAPHCDEVVSLVGESTDCPGLLLTPTVYTDWTEPRPPAVRFDGGWTLTHERTGLAVSDIAAYPDPADCRDLARRLAGLGFDWDSFGPDIARRHPGIYAAVIEVLRTQRRYTCEITPWGDR